MSFRQFEMERWQSTYENRVDYNLSESGVDPLTLGELLALRATDAAGVKLGYGQSNGSDELRARIASLYRGGRDDGVVVMNGSAEANFIALWQLVQPDDEIAILLPTYMQTHGLARNFGARVLEIPLREELGWQPDPDQIRRALSDRTRVLVVTNPGNPTGIVLANEVRNAIIETTARTGTWLLADEVYTGAELSGMETPSFFGSTERVIATGSLSKAYGIPGLRIGWAMTDAATAESLWAHSDYTTISPGELTDFLACLALHPQVRPQLLARTRGIIREGLDILSNWMRDEGIFHWRAPDAGAICFARYDVPIDSGELAEQLRTQHSVLIVPGIHFNLGPYIRFGIGTPRELPAALARMSSALRAVAVAS